jgi:hypothetical protein
MRSGKFSNSGPTLEGVRRGCGVNVAEGGTVVDATVEVRNLVSVAVGLITCGDVQAEKIMNMENNNACRIF